MLAEGVPAYLVLDHSTMAEILRDERNWTRDSRLWTGWASGRVGPDSELAPMMQHRKNVLFAGGEMHTRLRKAVCDALATVDERTLEGHIRTVATRLIDSFAADGAADLVTQYAMLMPLLTFNQLFDLDPQDGDRLLEALRRIWDGDDAAQANATYQHILQTLLHRKRAWPAADITSALLRHPAALSDEELLEHLVLIIGAGNAPTADLIGNALSLLLTDGQVGREVAGARLSVRDAIDQALWLHCPMQAYPFVYARSAQRIGNLTIPQGAAVAMGLAAANLSVVEQMTGPMPLNRAYISFGVGRHHCPGDKIALKIAEIAIEELRSRLPKLALAIPADAVAWRQSLFARAVAALPVVFSPATTSYYSLQEGSSWMPGSSSSTPVPPPSGTSTSRPSGSVTTARSSLWSFLTAWWRGR
ncbi:cytochrome P450 [Streptosporangium canum]|uniref:cytochrome P450 n=1 Tax=Streptosporangium canum TaxID=324952 RepID=UPI0036BFD7FB